MAPNICTIFYITHADFLGLSQTVRVTGFPVFVSKNLQFIQVLVMVVTATLHNDSNNIQDPYLCWPITNVTPRIFTISIPKRHPSDFSIDS